jgi:phosphate transport system substrate-binding protein
MKKMTSILLFCLVSTAISAVRINGAGASFPYPIYSKWFSEYQKSNTGVEFNYQAIGSGGGIRQLLKQTVDFGASDAPMKDKELKKAAWPVMHVPTVLGAVAVIYNLKEVPGLKLSSKTLSDIYLGKITKWNDPLIAKENPKTKLPAKSILVVRRADGSGTSAVFTDYLSEVSPMWKKKVGKGKSVKWPVGIGAKGSDGVTGVVKQTEGSVGYVEVAYAMTNNLSTATLKNAAGKLVAPTVAGVSAAAAGIKDFSGDLRVSIVNSSHPKAYPISAFTYILLPRPVKTSAKLDEVKKFLNWALKDGQTYAKSLHYAPLPKKLSSVLLKKINSEK